MKSKPLICDVCGKKYNHDGLLRYYPEERWTCIECIMKKQKGKKVIYFEK